MRTALLFASLLTLVLILTGSAHGQDGTDLYLPIAHNDLTWEIEGDSRWQCTRSDGLLFSLGLTQQIPQVYVYMDQEETELRGESSWEAGATAYHLHGLTGPMADDRGYVVADLIWSGMNPDPEAWFEPWLSITGGELTARCTPGR